MYADDGSVMAQSAGDLQDCMNVVSKYCSDWNLELIVAKMEIIVFGTECVLEPNIYYKGIRLNVVKQFKYLGVPFKHNYID